ncbi:MAG: S-layer homology domain-containing protein, partial [Firmicutes bacterium]|nr:S-layer homology domain-containing protein [Bacillota bacterium]
YSVDTMKLSGTSTKSIESYLEDDVDEYKFTSGRKDVVTVNDDGEVTGKGNGVGYVLCKHDDGDIIQIFITVSGISEKKTTKETTTETTTQATTVKTTSAPVQSVPVFIDIDTRPWAVEAINNMASKGIIKGIGNNRFDPDNNCKRCDFAIVLTKMIGLDSEIATQNYADIKLGEYYYNYVGIAKKYGIESGVDGDSFHPMAMITREDIMVMTYKGLKQKGYTFNVDQTVLNGYNDASLLRNESREAVAALVNAKAVSGTSATTLDPSSNITRAQMAVLMNNVVKFIDNGGSL